MLAGGLLKSDQEYFDSLKKRIVGHAIFLLPNISHTEILLLYKKHLFIGTRLVLERMIRNLWNTLAFRLLKP